MHYCDCSFSTNYSLKLWFRVLSFDTVSRVACDDFIRVFDIVPYSYLSNYKCSSCPQVTRCWCLDKMCSQERITSNPPLCMRYSTCTHALMHATQTPVIWECKSSQGVDESVSLCSKTSPKDDRQSDISPSNWDRSSLNGLYFSAGSPRY